MKKSLGDLHRRIILNYRRLTGPLYSYPEIFRQRSDWAGDFEGRGILALISLYRALEGYPKERRVILRQLKEIFLHLEEYLNEDGYFGEIFQGDYVDEQQLSGNSWYIRGLIEYYRLSGDPKCLALLKSIVETYLLPIAPFFSRYPSSPRAFGGVGGHSSKELVDGWKVSTDVGCAFISLDGYTHVYELTQDERLKGPIERIIEKFLTIDFVSLECQTHATLSCARGILRFYEVTKEERYLACAENIFREYLKKGMTLDYGNINWFNRPLTWTEPCCIVDSMILSKKLYLLTKDEAYLQMLNRTYINAVRTFQRKNGGAGCSTCAYADRYEMRMFLYEAFFCCTMRLGEGFAELQEFSVSTEDASLLLPLSSDGEYQSESIALEFETDVYAHPAVRLKIARLLHPTRLLLYVPSSCAIGGYEKQGALVSVPVQEPGTVVIPVSLPVQKEGRMLFRGDMLLTVKKDDSASFFRYHGKEYSPLYDNSQFGEQELKGKVQYVG